MIERTEYTYDLFISYADADRAWVEGYLLDALQATGVRVHSEEAFRLGVPRLLEFERAVQESQRVLLVLSPAYLAEGFNQFADLLAQSYGLETATWPVIPLILQAVELPPRLAMLTALDATDPAQWSEVVERLCAELQRPVPGPAPKPPCPYPGMIPFSEAESGRFFGRDGEVQELLERLRLHPFLTVIGPSGSGKSSLTFAGLVPALRRSSLFGSGEWLVRALRPGESPLLSLAIALRGDPADPAQAVSDLLATQPDASRLLLVVDQFEELFTLAHSDVETFQLAMLRLAETPNCYLILTIRADFYPDLMASPLWSEIQAHRVEVLPLDEEGLRQAIVRPAEGVGVFIETALVERLVADAAGEPGILPFTQETLVLLWDKVERRYLPLRAYNALILSAHSYRELGGVQLTGLQVAMARRADAALAALTIEQQAVARRVFLRLVQFGEGRADTRRQQSAAALRASDDDARVFDQTLLHLAGHRLLTLGGEEESAQRTVDIAHEALIGGWPTLQGWLGERREAEQTRRRLEAKAAEWERLGRGSGGLLDEVELLEAERWLESSDAADLGLGEALPALVQASRAAQKEAAAQQRRAARFRLRALGAIAALIIVALAIGFWSAQRQAQSQRQLARQQEDAAATAQADAIKQEELRIEAEHARETAVAEWDRAERLAEAEATARAEADTRRVEAVAARITAEAERDRAEEQARRALSSQLAVQAQSLLEGYPQRSLLLAAEALHVTMWAGERLVLAAEDALRQALANTGGRGLGGHSGGITAAAISPDNRWLVTGSWDGTVWLWDLATPNPAAAPIVLRGHKGWVVDLAISPDSRWLVTDRGDNTAWLWNLATLDPAATPIVLVGHQDDITAVAISPDNRWLVTGSTDNTVRLWDLTAPDPAAAAIVLVGHEAAIRAMAVSSDGHWLVTGSEDGTARLWDLGSPDPSAASVVLRGPEGSIGKVAISPDNRWLATGSGDNVIRLWDLAAPDPAAAPIVLHGQKDRLRAIAISPDSRWLAISSGDQYDLAEDVTHLWNLTTLDPAAEPIVLGGHKNWIGAVAISPDSHWLVTGSFDSTAHLWDLTAPDPSAVPIVLRGHEDWIEVVTFSSDGRWLVTGGRDNVVRLWDMAALAAAPIVFRGPEDFAITVDISPDGRWLVTGGGAGLDATVRLWDLTALDPVAAPIDLRDHDASTVPLAVSSDGRWLVTHSGGGPIRLWDLTASDPTAAFTVLGERENTVVVADVSPNDRWLATGDLDGNVRLWDLTAPDPAAAVVALQGHEEAVAAVAISPDARWLVTGSQDGTAHLWDLTASDLVTVPLVLDGHKSGIADIAISPDSHWLVTGSFDSTARLWDLTALNPAATPVVLRGHEGWINAVAISPDGHWLVTAGTDTVARLWDLTAPDPAVTPILLHGHEDDITAAAITLDSRWLATGDLDGNVRLWDLTAPDPAAASVILRGHENKVTDIAISPDNHWLVTCSWDDTVRLWNLRLDELIDLACRTTGRNLTWSEWMQYFPGQPYRRVCASLPVHASVIEGELARAESLALTGGLESASLAYAQAAQWAIETGNADPNYLVCWFGSSSGFADAVSPACERAAELGSVSDFVVRKAFNRAQSLALAGASESASLAYEQLVQWAVETNNAAWGNSICWLGSLDGFAGAVLPACEMAVESEPGNGGYRDSRGLARALTGDYAGAIEDFEALIAWGEGRLPDEILLKRQGWIQRLGEGENPFDSATLEVLRRE